MTDKNAVAHRWEDPALRYNSATNAWTITGPDFKARNYNRANWTMVVTFERKPFKVGDRVLLETGDTGTIVAIHKPTQYAWVTENDSLTPFTLPLANLMPADDV